MNSIWEIPPDAGACLNSIPMRACVCVYECKCLEEYNPSIIQYAVCVACDLNHARARLCVCVKSTSIVINQTSPKRKPTKLTFSNLILW